MVAAAGPATNLLIALIFGVVVRLAMPFGLGSGVIELSSYIVYINILLALFNLIPFPPLDGSKIIQPFLPFGLAMKYRDFIRYFEAWGLIATFLFLFLFINLLWAPFSTVVFALFRLITGLGGL